MSLYISGCIVLGAPTIMDGGTVVVELMSNGNGDARDFCIILKVSLCSCAAVDKRLKHRENDALV